MKYYFKFTEQKKIRDIHKILFSRLELKYLFYENCITYFVYRLLNSI